MGPENLVGGLHANGSVPGDMRGTDNAVGNYAFAGLYEIHK